MRSLAFLLMGVFAASLLAADDQHMVASGTEQPELAAAPALPWRPDEWQVGATGTLGGPAQGTFGLGAGYGQAEAPGSKPATYPPRVLQVIDKQSCLARYLDRVVRIEGFDTKGLVDDVFLWRSYVYRVVGTRSYETAGGDTKTTWVLVVTNGDARKCEQPADDDSLIAAYDEGLWYGGRPFLGNAPESWREGWVGELLDAVEVFQVIDGQNFLISYSSIRDSHHFIIWVEGDSSSMSDDRLSGEKKVVRLKGLFKVTTCSYQTRGDFDKTIWKLVPWQNDRAWERVKEHIATVEKQKEEERRKREASQLDAERQKKVRIWTDASGKFSVKAEYLGYKAGNVSLRREDDGREISVALNKLSDEDRKWVRDKIFERNKAKSQAVDQSDARNKSKVENVNASRERVGSGYGGSDSAP